MKGDVRSSLLRFTWLLIHPCTLLREINRLDLGLEGSGALSL